MTPEQRAKALRQAGWQQGSVCASSDVPALLQPPAHPAMSIEEADWLVVTTQTCDLLQGDLAKEPQVELLRFTPVRPDVSASLGWTQHPRYLQIERGLAGARLYACIHDRVWVPRNRFDTLAPDANRKLDPEDTRMLAKWLASRYLRPAYPDAFNDRLKPIQKALAGFWKAHKEQLRAAYCAFACEEELPEDEPYEVAFVLVHPRILPAADAQSLVDAFEKVFESCPGIEVDAKPMADIDFSLAHLDRYTRWDLDYLSFADPNQSTFPPPQADLA
jgi:hypothetical protein